MTTVGFIGLGLMGEGMARRLISVGGHKLVVWNRTGAKCDALVQEAGADKVTAVPTPAAVLEACDLIYVMLSTPAAVKEVYEMEGGILSGVCAGKQLIDCATLAVEDVQWLNAEVIKRGGRFLEAPVSGSKGPAAQGQLIFLAGGDEALYTSIAADLDAMGKAKFFLGEVGGGTKMKLCVNMVMGSMLTAYGEGLSLAQSSGLDASQLLEVLDLGVCASPLLKLKGPKMLAAEHAPNFPLKHAEKDMMLAINLGKSTGLELPVAQTVDATMKRAIEKGLGDEDFNAVFKAQKQ
eukprot:CAMPEP_0174721170 /NCGR_PEP_ID=MMETSP1094-20130205/35470_1 /TAXON_ID=156173 /ORGANISM="Chrysochromulina brevifilum, Strain UTEX LB 985" /LENGTH=292 /DNA_ID=CAMNT_0015921805 /DNA_START=28 /DNA_END=906 /DNA_ORIENTATION=+